MAALTPDEPERSRRKPEGKVDRKEPTDRTASSLELAAEDLLRLTEGVDLTVELEPATGSRLKGSYWVASLPSLGVTASALGLDATIDLLAFEALGAADEVIRGGENGREERLPSAVRVLALERLGRLAEVLGSDEVVAERYLETVRSPDGAS